MTSGKDKASEKRRLKEQLKQFKDDAHSGIAVAFLNVDQWQYVPAKFLWNRGIQKICIQEADGICHEISPAEVQGVYSFLESTVLWHEANESVAPCDHDRAIVIVYCKKDGARRTICLLESSPVGREAFVSSLKILLDWQNQLPEGRPVLRVASAKSEEKPAPAKSEEIKCNDVETRQKIYEYYGACTVVHPGHVLEYDPAEYSISEKDFQVKYECERTLNKDYRQRSQQRLQAKKSTSLLKSMSNLVSGNANSTQGPLPTLLRSQSVITEKVKKTTMINWQDVEAAYTYGYLEKHMSESQLTLCLRNSYGHLGKDMDKAVFLQYTLPGYPNNACLLCLLVEDNAERSGQRDTFVKSLNAHAESAKKRKAKQEALQHLSAIKGALGVVEL